MKVAMERARVFAGILVQVLWIGVLTLLTQTGGIIWLLAMWAAIRLKPRWPYRGLKWALFGLFYAIATLLIIPPLARLGGRVPLPIFQNPNLKPESKWFCFLNRTYVHPALRQALEETAQQLQERHPGTVVWYMDANFPFFDGYPLEPHFSHRDGKKVDVSVYWTDLETNRPVQGNPSPIGYGAFAAPLPNERDYAAACATQGYWYIGLTGDLASPFFDKSRYRFDEGRTRDLLRLLATHPAISRVLIQPHLKQRLGLSSLTKLRFQGCKAARHDDHAHVELH